jgi:UDP-N-acetylmuramoylalanine--D-glutamate ligase
MQRLVILGGGESGVGTAILGKKQGYDVFVSDFGEIKDNYREVLKQYEIKWEDETHTESLILNADVVMKSPGIPEKAPIVKALIEKGIPVISEIGLLCVRVEQFSVRRKYKVQTRHSHNNKYKSGSFRPIRI